MTATALSNLGRLPAASAICKKYVRSRQGWQKILLTNTQAWFISMRTSVYKRNEPRGGTRENQS